jgi:EAL domain-containing protein (putative c-di-GMP-specific phosphodiesterase class I)
VDVLNLEHRLRFALERNQFELHYQPKVDVVTRRIQGAEALLRWRSPEDGLVSPDAFLPVLESSGLIQPVGEWVVQQAARDCLAWQEARLPPVRIAVNISPAQLRHHEFEERFLQVVKPWVGRSRGLDIEITEGVLQEDCGAEIRKLERLRTAGVRIAVDDFGTGYSSLSRLSSLPVDTLKIDRRFISQVVDSPAGAAVVKTVVALAHAFKMTTVAEGVERQQELDMLWQIGCNQSQGYLHCMPLRAEEFIAVIRNGKGKLVQPPAPEE